MLNDGESCGHSCWNLTTVLQCQDYQDILKSYNYNKIY